MGGLGVIDDITLVIGQALPPGHALVLIGETEGWLGQSLWLREVLGREEGAPPPVDFVAERKNGDWVRGQIVAGAIAACHDLSDGGLLIAVAEMAMSGSTGVTLKAPPAGVTAHGWWFGEDQARYLIAVKDADVAIKAAQSAGVAAFHIGDSQTANVEQALILSDGTSISLQTVQEANARFFPAWMDG
jgi:phosphoribosylformylglycinamidine (FGAM) synthase-like enzyme